MTPRQRQAIDLRASGLMWSEVGARMGITGATAQNTADHVRQNAYQRLRHRVMGQRTVYTVERSADWWLPDDDDAAEVLRVAVMP